MAVTTINIDSQVLTFANLAAFPITGTVKTIYIAEDTNFQYYWDGSQYVLLTTDINIPANLIFYATTAPSSVPGYERLVISPDDVDYDNPAVDVPTGAITTTAQLVGEQVADADIFAGNPGILNISTIGEIRRTSGTGTAEFYFEIYQRTSLGVETLIGTSNKTAPISGGVYQQFQVDCLFNNGTWLSTDRVVIKFYADRVAGGSNPNYDFLFGGANPVRTLFPISAQLLLNVPIAIGITGVTGGILDEVLLTDGSGKLGQSELKTVGGNSLFGSGDIPVGGGITIGTTAIASGTVNRILFQGAGNVVQQDSTFVWNNTDKRLILGTEAVADTNSRLVVIGRNPSGTGTTFAVHNSTGTNNALVVRDDTRVGIGTASPNAQLHVEGAFPGKVGLLINGTNLAANNGSFAVWQNSGVDRGYIYVADVGSDALRGIKISNPTATSELMVATGTRGVTVTNAGSFTNTNAFQTAVTNLLGATTPLTVFGADVNLSSLGSIINHIHNTNTVGRQSQLLHRFFTSTNVVADYGGFGTELMVNTNAAHSGDLFFRTALTGTFAERMRLKASGNLLIGTTSENAGSTKVLVINNGTAPSGNVTDSFQQYSSDIVAGNAAPHFRTENGDIVKIYRVGGWGLPTGSFTRTTFATNTVTLEQLAERVAALIQDLRDNHQLLKA
jgi:hypothetical protein